MSTTARQDGYRVSCKDTRCSLSNLYVSQVSPGVLLITSSSNRFYSVSCRSLYQKPCRNIRLSSLHQIGLPRGLFVAFGRLEMTDGHLCILTPPTAFSVLAHGDEVPSNPTVSRLKLIGLLNLLSRVDRFPTRKKLKIVHDNLEVSTVTTTFV